jgi:hypothetical protein
VRRRWLRGVVIGLSGLTRSSIHLSVIALRKPRLGVNVGGLDTNGKILSKRPEWGARLSGIA